MCLCVVLHIQRHTYIYMEGVFSVIFKLKSNCLNFQDFPVHCIHTQKVYYQCNEVGRGRLIKTKDSFICTLRSILNKISSQNKLAIKN